MMFKLILALTIFVTLSSAQLNIGARFRSATKPRPRPVVQRPVAPLQPKIVAPPKAVVVEDEAPQPYSFSYNNADEFGTQWTREESGDENGVVKGSYSYRDANGLFREVTYIADADGFRAVVNSNEPGLIPHKPADVVYNVVTSARR